MVKIIKLSILLVEKCAAMFLNQSYNNIKISNGNKWDNPTSVLNVLIFSLFSNRISTRASN